MTFRQQLLSSSNCCLLFSAKGRHREQQIFVDVAQLVSVHNALTLLSDVDCLALIHQFDTLYASFCLWTRWRPPYTIKSFLPLSTFVFHKRLSPLPMQTSFMDESSVLQSCRGETCKSLADRSGHWEGQSKCCWFVQIQYMSVTGYQQLW